ncbi:DNA-processing protein DprA [Prosthecomicrobium hirschii]|uniref:DNA-processing protein DprA n=1 Tax=Prosthecodimorpha hirschii TaxID=665126 RepID=UPI000B328EAE|nr:DNA-processing protein DprA [Prosthecomicrobium hirschii]
MTVPLFPSERPQGRAMAALAPIGLAEETRPPEGQFHIRLTERQRRSWLKLIRADNVGPNTFIQLLNRFGSAADALDALPDLARRGGANRIRIPTDAEIDLEWAAAQRAGARFVALGEADYPAYLRAVEGPPPILAVAGDAGVFTRPAVGIVGSRNASLAGRKIAGQFARDLGAQGFAIVSGLARGIDAAAHMASLETGTIGVFAGGLDRVYPPEHADLVARIVATGGAIVSELPFGWEPRARDFPRRNRLISGISMGLVVVEAARRSGSLHTARFAGEQGRDLFAVPGSPLDPRAEGTNDLIRNGATLVASAEHVVEALGPQLGRDPPPPSAWEPPAGPGEGDGATGDAPADLRAAILEALGPTPVAVDEIIRATGARPGLVQLVLLELSLAGRLERHAGGKVSLLM